MLEKGTFEEDFYTKDMEQCVCPYCRVINSNPVLKNGQVIKCFRCSGKYKVEISFAIYYSTKKVNN